MANAIPILLHNVMEDIGLFCRCKRQGCLSRPSRRGPRLPNQPLLTVTGAILKGDGGGNLFKRIVRLFEVLASRKMTQNVKNMTSLSPFVNKFSEK